MHQIRWFRSMFCHEGLLSKWVGHWVRGHKVIAMKVGLNFERTAVSDIEE